MKNEIIKTYHECGSIRMTAAMHQLSTYKVRKLLIDAGEYTNEVASQVNELHDLGLSVEEIAEQLEISPKAVSGYLPYTKGPYGSLTPTKNAQNIRAYRARKSKQP